LAEANWLFRFVGNKVVDNVAQSPFVNVTGEQLLWGYDDKLFTIASKVMEFQDNKLPFSEFGIMAGVS